MRTLVTGAGGFLGRILVEVLHTAGHEVVAVDRSALDLCDAPAVRAFAAAVGPVDAVAHLAARTRVRESHTDPAGHWAANVGGTANLLAALEPPAVVLASTCAVYGSRPGTLVESLAPAPASPYAASKHAAEELLRQHAATGRCGATVLRCANLAGGWHGIADPDRTRIVNNALAVAAGERPHLDVHGDGGTVRDLVHGWDAARAFRLALESTAPGTTRVYNVGTGTGTSVAEVVAAARAVTGHPVPVVHHPAADEPRVLVAGIDLIRAELGWSPERSGVGLIVHDAWLAMRGSA